jgi:hypothetical protein
MDRHNKRASSNLGLVLGQEGRFQEAFEAFRDAGSSEADAHSNLAFIFLTKGKLEDARRECLVAQQLNPACKPARNMLAKMDAEGKDAPKAVASRPGRTAPRQLDREAVRRSLPPEFRGEDPPAATVARASQPAPRSSADAEGPAPAYTSPNGTKWFAVPQGTKWHSVKPEQAPPAPANSNGNPGTITFDQGPENGD